MSASVTVLVKMAVMPSPSSSTYFPRSSSLPAMTLTHLLQCTNGGHYRAAEPAAARQAKGQTERLIIRYCDIKIALVILEAKMEVYLEGWRRNCGSWNISRAEVESLELSEAPTSYSPSKTYFFSNKKGEVFIKHQ